MEPLAENSVAVDAGGARCARRRPLLPIEDYSRVRPHAAHGGTLNGKKILTESS